MGERCETRWRAMGIDGEHNLLRPVGSCALRYRGGRVCETGRIATQNFIPLFLTARGPIWRPRCVFRLVPCPGLHVVNDMLGSESCFVESFRRFVKYSDAVRVHFVGDFVY